MSLVTISRFQTPNFDSLLLRRDRLRDELDEIEQAAYRLKKKHGIKSGRSAEIWKKLAKPNNS